MKKLITISVLALVLGGCSSAVPNESTAPGTPTHAPSTASAAPTPTPSTSPSPSPSPTPTSTASSFTIQSGGDILLHLSVNEAARIQGETYDFTPYWEPLSEWIKGADISICALEIPIIGPDQMPSNYPNFGAPYDLAKSLKAAGFDGCAVATNHTMDRGFGGVTTTIEALSEAGLGWSGSARTAAEADEIQFYTARAGGRDIKVAHISATTLTNGIPIPADHPYSWNVVGEFGDPVQSVIDDARRARSLGADLVVVSMHWGTEYVSEPIAEQLDIADQFAASGQIDLVFGNHSHVPEPVTEIDGGPRGEGMWVVWSMGNQISGQTVKNHGYRVTTGLLTTATVDVPAEGPATVRELEWTAVTQDRLAGEKLRPLHPLVAGDYPPDLALGSAEIKARADVTYPVMEGSGAERTTPPQPQTEFTPQRLSGQ